MTKLGDKLCSGMREHHPTGGLPRSTRGYSPARLRVNTRTASMLNTEGGDYDEENEDTSPIYSMRRRRAGGQAPEASAPDHEYGGTSGCAADCQCGCRD